MKYTVEEINHIIYNNRTYEGVTKNFIPKLSNFDILLLLEIEKQIKFVNKLISKDKFISIDESKLDLEQDDIELFPEDLAEIKISSREFSKSELELIERKKLPSHIIEQYDISPLSQVRCKDTLTKLSVTTHPILFDLLGDDLYAEGLIVPLYREGKLINSTIRKTVDMTKLKYATCVPSLDLWGDEDWKGKELGITEGTFDMMAIREQGLCCVSSSSGSLNDIQYFKIIKGKPKMIKLFVDNDSTGYSSAIKAQKIFGLNGIEARTYSSNKAKDMAEHFFELGLGWDEISEIKITHDMIKNAEDNVFDFLAYLEKRKF